jgi:hypothetical protein
MPHTSEIKPGRVATGVPRAVGPEISKSAAGPAWASDERVYLAEIAAAPNRYPASGVVNALGSAATVSA